MMTEKIFLSVSLDDFKSIIGEVVSEKVSHLKEPSKETTVLLTRKETAQYLRVSLPTLNELTKRGVIVGQRIGGRLLYSEGAINAALTATTSFRKKGGRG